MMRGPRLSAWVVSAMVGLTGLAISGAPPAAADQVWHQSVGRASADAACPISSAADLAAGWTSWGGSWERWANGDTGGFTCTRAIIWAKSTPPPSESPSISYPSGGCELGGGGTYVNFAGGWFVVAGSPLYSDDTCTTSTTTTNDLVYAPVPFDARALCITAFGRATDFAGPFGLAIYDCNRRG